MALSEAQQRAALEHMEGRRPKYHKGIYGKKHDYHTCGACGAVVTVGNNYCGNCGTRVLWDDPRCLTGYKEVQDGKKESISGS